MRIALEDKTFVGLGLEGCADVGDYLDEDEDVRLGEEEGKEKERKRTYIISPILRNLIQGRSIIRIINFPSRDL